MKRATIVLLLFAVLFQSCIDDDCKDIACFTPPEFFEFEIVDATTNENVFTNGTYRQSDIKITNTLDDNATVAFTFISEDNRNIFGIYSIGWDTEIVNLEVALGDNTIFEFYVDAEAKSENCCAFTIYNEKTISGTEYEQDAETGIYKILLD